MDEANIRVKMQSTLDLVRADVGSIRTGRASPALVEDLVITAYGGTQKLKVIELATIHASDQTLLISPFDKSISLEIKKGIEEANVGLNPQVTGQDIRINLEPLTQEDRENYIKILKSKLETGKIMVRQARQEAMQSVKRQFEAKEISEDEQTIQEKRVQDLTDEYIKKIDEIGSRKETELRSV